MKISFWQDFLLFFEKNNQKTPVVLSALKQLRPVSINGRSLILSCENIGLKIFLDKKKELMESTVSSFLNKSVEIEFVLVKKRIKNPSPLLSFRPSAEDFFSRAGLHAKYRFDNFAVSSTNQVAYAATQAVSEKPGDSYNPLFLYGGVGVGKTHLAQAAARHIIEKDNEKRVFFCPGDQFTNELIESIRERATPRFRKKYRHLRLLVIDDIQFIAGKNTVQEEFFHTFNSVVSSGGQIILTSDRPPSEIKNLEDRLRSRFSGGLIVDVQPPNFELRTAIIQIKAREKGIEIDINAAKIIAERIGDSRALEGTLLTIYAKTLGKKEKIDMETVELFFNEKAEKQIRRFSPHDIIKAICSYYNVKQTHLKSPQRHENIAFPRQVAMYLLRRELNLKYEEIAYILKRKDHTTIMHGFDKISSLMMKNSAIKQEVDSIILSLNPST